MIAESGRRNSRRFANIINTKNVVFGCAGCSLRQFTNQRSAIYVQWMGMVERSMTAAEAGRTGNRTLHVVASAPHRGVDRHALRETGGDSRSKRAAGAMRVTASDTRADPFPEIRRRRQYVVHRIAFEMPAFQQHRAAAEADERPRRIAHRGNIADRAAAQDFSLWQVRGQHRSEWDETTLQRVDSIRLD